MLGLVFYTILGGRMWNCTTIELIGYCSTLAEGLGLLSLRMQITKNGGVKGISGRSVSMFAITYTVRLWQMWPRSTRRLLDSFAVEVLSLASLLLVLEILVCVFWTYRKSYQEDIDVLKVRYLVPLCFVASMLIHPSFRRGFFYSYFWTLGFYLDIVALLPQVVMMAKGGGKIEAPISNFVAATTLSRSIDLYWWMNRGLDLGPQGFLFGFNFSGYLIVVIHIFGLVLAADFMYYYLKARVSGSNLSEDLVLPQEDLC